VFGQVWIRPRKRGLGLLCPFGILP
jgi:hypothetical protein